MSNSPFIQKTIDYIQVELINAEAGHDWQHIKRVWTNALHIAQFEQVNNLVVELAALLHDIADSKSIMATKQLGLRKQENFWNPSM